MQEEVKMVSIQNANFRKKKETKRKKRTRLAESPVLALIHSVTLKTPR